MLPSTGYAWTGRDYRRGLQKAAEQPPEPTAPAELLALVPPDSAGPYTPNRAALDLLARLQTVRDCAGTDGWYTHRSGFTMQFAPLVRAGYLTEDLRREAHAVHGHFHRRYFYKLTAKAQALLDTNESETSMDLKPGDKVIVGLKQATVLEIGTNDRVNIRYDGETHPIWVDADGVHKPEPAIHAPQPLVDLARQFFSNLNAAALHDEARAFQLVLRHAYVRGISAADGWFELTSRDTQDHRRNQLLKSGHLEKRTRPVQGFPKPIEWRITAAGCALIDKPLLPYLDNDDDAAAGADTPIVDSVNNSEPEPIVNSVDNSDEPPAGSDEDLAAWREYQRPRVEIKTLAHLMKHSLRGDEELAEHLNAGWSILDISYAFGDDTSTCRYITLRRDTQPTSPNGAYKAHMVEPVGPPITVGPLARAILVNGVEAVQRAGDEKVMNSFREAWDRVQARQSTPPSRYLIPGSLS